MTDKITVLGAGTMGSGIAQLAAQSGYDVLLYDVKEDFVQRGMGNIKSALQSRVDKGKMEGAEMQSIVGRIATTTRRDDAASSHLIIEAAPEDMALEREIFASLSAQCSPRHNPGQQHIVPFDHLYCFRCLATRSEWSGCTSSTRPLSCNWWRSSRPTAPLQMWLRTAREVAQRMGKTPVRASDMPGFIVNRVARPFYGEALKILGEGTATVPAIDAAMRAAGFRMGPFELMDLIGIDINFAVTKSVYEAFFGESRYRPSPIQQRMVEANTLGRKTGQGFYHYNDGQIGEPAYNPTINLSHKRSVPFVPEHLTEAFLANGGIEVPEGSPEQGEIAVRILAMIMNEAAHAVGEGVASVRDVDIAMKLGTNYPKGPLKWADEIGLDVVFNILKSLDASLGDERYHPAPLLRQMVRSGATGDAVGEGWHTPGEKGMV